MNLGKQIKKVENAIAENTGKSSILLQAKLNIMNSIVKEPLLESNSVFIETSVLSESSASNVAKQKSKLDKTIISLKKEKDNVREKITKLRGILSGMDSSTGSSERVEGDIKVLQEREKDIKEDLQRRIEEYNKFVAELKLKENEANKTNKSKKLTEDTPIELSYKLVNDMPEFKSTRELEAHGFLLRESIKTAVTKSRAKVKDYSEKKKSARVEKKRQIELDKLQSIIDEKNIRYEKVKKDLEDLDANLVIAKKKNLVGNINAITKRIALLKTEKVVIENDIKKTREESNV